MSLSNLPVIVNDRRDDLMNHIVNSEKYFAEALLLQPVDNLDEILDSVHLFKNNDQKVNAILVNWLVVSLDEWTQLPSFYVFTFSPERYVRPQYADANEKVTIDFKTLLGYDEEQAIQKAFANKHILTAQSKFLINLYKKVNL